jgi:glycosyltransferase involved in cell wall biosynthesis
VDVDCDTAAMVRQSGSGTVVPPGDGPALAQAVWDYFQDPFRREAAGHRGRWFFLEHFEKHIAIQSYLTLIEELLSG